MKKFLTIALALVMVLAIAAPAMAFTGTTTATSTTAPALSIYLVDYSNSGFFGIAALPAADRGYAKNEIVAAVAEIKVLKGTTMTGYDAPYFSGTNVSLNVTDNKDATSGNLAAVGVTGNVDTFKLNSDKDKFVRSTVLDNAPTADTTYKWMFFAKITADGAKLAVTLPEKSAAYGFGTFTLSSVSYTVAKSAPGYVITVNNGDYANAVIKLAVDSNNKTTGMSIKGATGSEHAMGVTVGGVLGYVDSTGAVVTAATSSNDFAAVMGVYNDVVVKVFGLDYFKIGNYLYDSFFTGLTSPKTLTASVDIKPWVAYVTVPSEVVVTPPKTGDAAGIMGFVMIVLAAAAAVVVKKVRA